MADAAPPFRHETQRLVLRDWRDGDWAQFWKVTNTPAVMQWLGGVCDAQAMAGARARLEQYRNDHGHTFWVVERKGDREILGFCGLKRCTEQDGPLGMMEAGWRLREDVWGQGYAKEAALASLEIGFTQFDADEIIALTVQGNKASWGLMQRIGMERRPDLDFPEAMWSQNYGDVIVYSVTRDAWSRCDG